MKITIYYIGKDKKNHFTEIEALYVKRISHYVKIEIKKIKPEKFSSSLAISEIQKKEAELFRNHLKNETRVILMDEGGKLHDSQGFSKYLETQISGGGSSIAIVIGGAYGFSDDIKRHYKNVVSLSKLTFAHHLARTVLLEQIYRAFSIINNEPYHNS